MPVGLSGLLTPSELAGALDEQRVVAVFQPCFDLRTGVMVAVEALARIRDSGTGRLLPPSVFLPTAEDCGLVGRLDAVVAGQAMEQVARWRALPDARHLAVAVNTSVADLDDEGLPGRLFAQAAAAGLPLDALIVEVTETVLSESGRGHEQVLTRLSDAGCNVTLDDFGTGNSSVSYLQRFAADGLKVDRSFVAQLGTGGSGELLVESFIRFCLSLGVHVVAEGIETTDQLEALHRLGVPFGQGYLLGRPMTAVELEALLVGHHRAGAPSPASPAPLTGPAAPTTERPRRTLPRPHLMPAVAAVVALLLLVLSATLVQSRRDTERSLVAAGQDKLQAVNALAAAAVGTRLSALDGLVTAHSRREAALAALRTGDPAQQRGLLESLGSASRNIFSASLYDASGRLLALAPEAPGVVGRSFAYRDWFQGAKGSDHAYLSEAFQLVTSDQTWAIASAAAVRDGSGRIEGYLVATFALDSLQRLVDGFEAMHGIGLSVINVRGQVLAASGRGAAQLTGRTSTDPRAGGAGPSVVGPDTQWDIAPVPDVGGVVLAEQPVATALAAYAHESGRTLLVLASVALVALLVLGLLLRADRGRRRLLADLDRTGHDLRQAHTWVTALLESAPTAVLVTGPDGTVRQANQACVAMLGTTRDALESQPLSDWLTDADEPGDAAEGVRLARPSRAAGVLEVRTQSLDDPQGELVQVHTLTDVTPHRAERDRLHRQGRTDSLTGVANRRALQDALLERLDPAAQQTDEVQALVMLDLDGFKSVNDTLGHGVGDTLLVDIAHALVAASEPGALVARLGGDEFVVLARLAAPGSLQDQAELLRRAVRKAARRTTRGTDLTVDVSIGTAVLGQDGRDTTSVLRSADERMYADKRSRHPMVPLPRVAG
jgi:diguanylate cyclase (GGDEF)-like protein